MRKKLNQFGYLGWIISVSALILFGCSSLRHELFQSNAFDLGIYDQAIYLISQGQPPISSFIGFHILGDHASWIFYPLALLYKIYPSVYWLFASNRKLITFTIADSPPTDLINTFNYVLLNVRHPGWSSSQEFAASLVNQLKNNQKFQLKYQRDDVYLFVKVA